MQGVAEHFGSSQESNACLPPICRPSAWNCVKSGANQICEFTSRKLQIQQNGLFERRGRVPSIQYVICGIYGYADWLTQSCFTQGESMTD